MISPTSEHRNKQNVKSMLVSIQLQATEPDWLRSTRSCKKLARFQSIAKPALKKEKVKKMNNRVLNEVGYGKTLEIKKLSYVILIC